MASLISAGTSTNTAVSITGDTTGALALATNNGTTALTIDTSQNVGIGTASPAGQLHLAKASDLVFTQDGYGISWAGANNGSPRIYGSAAGSGGVSGYLAFKASTGGEAMRIAPSGLIGMGTSSPAVHLDVVSPNNGATAWAWFHGNTGGATPSASINSGIMLGGNYSAGNSESNIMWGTGYNSATQHLLFSTWNNSTSTVTERMRITSGGDLLVSTTDAANASGNGVKIAGNGSGPYVAVVNPSSSGSNLGMSLYSSGASAFRFYADCGGTLHATSTSIAAISDASLKTNVKDLETGLTQVMALKPRRFDWINGDATNVAGFIAQEVEQILPELVTDSLYAYDENKNEVYKKNLKMGDMLPTLVKAIQELKTIVDAQAVEIAALKAKVGA